MSSALRPDLSPSDQARYLDENLPHGLFGADTDGPVAWRLTPQPFPLSPSTLAAIERLGPDLLVFSRTLNALYTRSARGTAPAFIADYLDRGKPETIVKLGRQNRFRGDVANVIRPDLILTEDGFIATELDSIPGGMGFVGAMARSYDELGYETIGTTDGMAEGFAAMLAAITKTDAPVTAIVVSKEAGDYRSELMWLADAMNRLGHGQTFVCSPEEIIFTEEERSSSASPMDAKRNSTRSIGTSSSSISSTSPSTI